VKSAASAQAIEVALRTRADPERAEQEKRYLRSSLTHYGVDVPTLHKISRHAAAGLDREALIALVTRLWDEPAGAPVHERRFVAADLLAARQEVLTPADLPVVERLLRESGTWALVDVLAGRVVGALVDRYPDDVGVVLDRWAVDPDFWVRRSALLAHLLPLRRGTSDWDTFVRHADLMLGDRHLFVAKAVGWVLRESGRSHPELVLAYLEPRVQQMASVTVREALKPLRCADRQRLQARRAAGPRAPGGRATVGR
jgi:3-methyladenine DNA glycosylase AlkD